MIEEKKRYLARTILVAAALALPFVGLVDRLTWLHADGGILGLINLNRYLNLRPICPGPGSWVEVKPSERPDAMAYRCEDGYLFQVFATSGHSQELEELWSDLRMEREKPRP